MKITAKQYSESLYQAVKDKNKKEVCGAINKFINILVENNDVSKINKIAELFEIIWNREEGIIETEVISAKKLDNKIVKLLNNYIVKLSGAKEVIMQEQIDKSVLGGVVIKYEDKIIDGSLKTGLDELKNKMVK